MRLPHLTTTIFLAVILVAWVVGSSIDARHTDHRLDFMQMEFASVKACVSNDAYQGKTAADTHELFFQCLNDYTASVTDK